MTQTQTLLVKSPNSPVVHRGRHSRLFGHVVTGCNGRTMVGFVLDEALAEQLHRASVCKRCAAKAVTT